MSSNHTFHGLHHWHKHMFEKLGWVLLALNRGGHAEKVKMYHHAIDKLELALNEYKLIEGFPLDKKHDIDVMIKDVEVLRQILTTCTTGKPVAPQAPVALGQDNLMAGGKSKKTKKSKSKSKSAGSKGKKVKKVKKVARRSASKQW